MTTYILALLLSFAPAQAETFAGVTMPDTVTVGGESLVLNGMGLREKFWFDIYVGGLYAKAKSTDSAALVAADEPKRIEMAFVYSEVSTEQLVESYEESLAKLPNKAAMRPHFDKLNAMMETVVSGDRMVFDYVPGTGTTITVKGKNKGVIEGAEFMQALWNVYIGPNPPTTKFKNGMIGQ